MNDLDRFRAAQSGVYETACEELRAGRKHSHWMWFTFPQMRGLGSSAMAETYGIGSRAEAEAYLADATLGPRLTALFEIVLAHESVTAREIFGTPDDLKFRSCATLFAALTPTPTVYSRAIDQFFGGQPDVKTLALPGRSG